MSLEGVERSLPQTGVRLMLAARGEKA